MSVVSIDIGIKNMAYCVFDVSGSVLDWSVVNLMDREPETKQCTNICVKKKISSVCGKKAKYEKNGVCYCQTHAKSSDFLLPDSKCSPTKIKKLKLEELKQLAATRPTRLSVFPGIQTRYLLRFLSVQASTQIHPDLIVPPSFYEVGVIVLR